MRNLFEYAKKDPVVFEKSPDNIWTNNKLNSFILNSHFKNEISGGSKDSSTIQKSIDFIDKWAKHFSFNKILDLGCGPGIYCHELGKRDYKVTGIDFSKNAISYAKNHYKNDNTNFICKDIFNFYSTQKYEVCLLIYYIYALFDKDKRMKLLKKIYSSLDNNGILILDVPSYNQFQKYQNLNFWNYFDKDNIYDLDPFILFYSIKKYEDNVLLNQSMYYFESGETITTYDWMQHFTKEQLKKELKSNGFKILGIYGDSNGEPFTKDSSNLSMVCQKHSENSL